MGDRHRLLSLEQPVSERRITVVPKPSVPASHDMVYDGTLEYLLQGYMILKIM